jgi:peptide deformylase
MSIQEIRYFGDPVLTTPASAVVDFDKELRVLVKDLTDTMLDAPVYLCVYSFGMLMKRSVISLIQL